MDSKRAILNKAAEIFMRYGLRSVTMDDLRRELCMSKKTLYQHFENKDDLIYQVLQQHAREEMENFARIHDIAEDAVEEFLLISQLNVDTLREASPVIIYDLRKYHPAIWNQMLKDDFGCSHCALTENLKRGQAEGLYRSELPVDLASRLYFAQVQGMINEHIFPPGFEWLEQAIIVKDNLFMRGVCTPAGLERLEFYRKNGLRELPFAFMGKPKVKKTSASEPIQESTDLTSL